MRLLLALVLALPTVLAGSMTHMALAAAGDLDPTFGNGGRVTTDFGANEAASALVLQPDGKLVAAGTTNGFDFALARYLPNGALDPSFGTGGRVTTDFGANEAASALVLQPDGKLVAAGGNGSDFALARYLPNGALDPSFGTGGRVTTNFGGGEALSALVLQPDGKLVATGTTNGILFPSLTCCFVLARYLPDGTLDPSFGTDGKVTTNFGLTASAMVLQPDGKLVVAGSSSGGFVLARYLPTGVLDPSFGTGGTVTTNFGFLPLALVLQPDGRLVAAGTNGSDFALARFLPNGALDPSFGTGGKVTTDLGGLDVVADLALQPDGKLVAAGGNYSAFALARYLPSGALDTTFGIGGKITTVFGTASSGRGGAAAALLLQPDGKLVAAGHDGVGNFALARYFDHGIGGSGLGITADGGRNQLTWTAGDEQLGYLVVREPTASAELPVGASAYTDVVPAPPPALNCYVLVPFGSAGALGVSDALCARQGLASPAGAPQNFTLRLNQSSTASLSWVNTPGAVGSVLVALPFNGSPARYQLLGASTTTATDATGGVFTCYLLVAGTLFGQANTDLACGQPGVSSLGTAASTATAPQPGTGGTEQARATAEQQVERVQARVRPQVEQIDPKVQEALREAKQRLGQSPQADQCNPRPRLSVTSVPAGSGRLQVTVSAGTTPAATPYHLLQLRATIPANARIDVVNGPSDLAGEQVLPIGAGTRPTVFVVRRIAPGGVTIPLKATDTCGEWPTFVGGGANAF